MTNPEDGIFQLNAFFLANGITQHTIDSLDIKSKVENPIDPYKVLIANCSNIAYSDVSMSNRTGFKIALFSLIFDFDDITEKDLKFTTYLEVIDWRIKILSRLKFTDDFKIKRDIELPESYDNGLNTPYDFWINNGIPRNVITSTDTLNWSPNHLFASNCSNIKYEDITKKSYTCFKFAMFALIYPSIADTFNYGDSDPLEIQDWKVKIVKHFKL